MRDRTKLLFGAAVCLFAGGGWGLLAPQPERITFLSVGQGDCAVVQAEGRTLLIDDGPSAPNFDSGERVLLPKLRELGVQSVDVILLSHPDLDHVGGTPALLRRFPEAKVVMSAMFEANPEMLEHLRNWRLGANQMVWLGPEAVGKVGQLEFRLSCPQHVDADNDGSMFVRVGRPGAEVVLSGDASSSVEDEEVRNGDWRAEVMKAGHHGSRTSTDSQWLSAVHPQWVVISCGRQNRYGHPHHETLERVQAAGAQTARTDLEGDVTFEWKGDRLVRE